MLCFIHVYSFHASMLILVLVFFFINENNNRLVIIRIYYVKTNNRSKHTGGLSSDRTYTKYYYTIEGRLCRSLCWFPNSKSVTGNVYIYKKNTLYVQVYAITGAKYLPSTSVRENSVLGVHKTSKEVLKPRFYA